MINNILLSLFHLLSRILNLKSYFKQKQKTSMLSQRDGLAGKDLAMEVSHPETNHQNSIAENQLHKLTSMSGHGIHTPHKHILQTYRYITLRKATRTRTLSESRSRRHLGLIWATWWNTTSTNNKQTTNPTNTTTSKDTLQGERGRETERREGERGKGGRGREGRRGEGERRREGEKKEKEPTLALPKTLRKPSLVSTNPQTNIWSQSHKDIIYELRGPK